MKPKKWKPVVDFELQYEVSDQGSVRCIAKARGAVLGRILRRQTNGVYPKVSLSKNSQITQRYVHRIVLDAFVGPAPVGCTASHLNDEPNDCRLINLLWEPHRKNCQRRSANRKAQGLPAAGWACL